MPPTVRSCSTAADSRRSLEIYNEVLTRRAATREDVQAWERASVASGDFLGAIDGTDAGSTAVGIPMSRPGVCVTFITVLPHLRRRGVGGALLDAARTWATDHRVQELEVAVESDDAASLGFALRRGFHEHSRELGLELELSELEPAPVDAPEGVEIVLLADHPELAVGAYEVGSEAIADVPGSEDWTPPPFEQFLGSHLRGIAVFVATAGDQVVGYAKIQGATDGRIAAHGMTAVKRAWRGRGIATALKRAQIGWAKANGIEGLVATNEERNVVMQHVNASLGYRPAPGRVWLRALLVR